MANMTLLMEAWNAQADAQNQWDELVLDEIVSFAVTTERSAWANQNRAYVEAAVLAEREACAALLEHAVNLLLMPDVPQYDGDERPAAKRALIGAAAAIRARGSLSADTEILTEIPPHPPSNSAPMMDANKLPPLPYPQMPGNDYTASDMHAYAQAAVMAERERCALIAVSGCLVPPDGGSPTDDERLLCGEIARRIRDA